MDTNKTTSVPESAAATETTKKENTMGIVAYITIIGLVVAIIINQEKKDPFVSFHIRQSLGIRLLAFALGIVNIIPVLGWIISFIGVFFVLYLWIMGIVNAAGHKQKAVPVLGEKFDQWFANAF